MWIIYLFTVLICDYYGLNADVANLSFHWLSTNYYRATLYHQQYCSICHNPLFTPPLTRRAPLVIAHGPAPHIRILAMLRHQELERTPANYCRAVKVIKAKRTFPAACESFIVMSNSFHRRYRPLAEVICQETRQNAMDSLTCWERL